MIPELIKLTGLAWFLMMTGSIMAQGGGEVVIPGSLVKHITSDIVKGQEYELQVMLPGGYEKSSRRYPVIYVLDAQWDFPLITAICGQQYYDGFIPELIVVGITWGGQNPDPDLLRTRDFTPTNDGRKIKTGGAGLFLEFLENELFPYIDNNYRTERSNRTLAGCSLGGLFTLYALFHQPSMFSGYIAATPAVGWDEGAIFEEQKLFSQKKTDLPVRVFMTVGGVETSRSIFEEMAGKLKNLDSENIDVESRILENTGHSGTKSETYSRGLQYVFKRNRMALSKEVLRRYTGLYESEKGDRIELGLNEEGNQLIEVNRGYLLYADNAHSFYANSSFFKIEIDESDHLVKGLRLATFGQDSNYRKVKE